MSKVSKEIYSLSTFKHLKRANGEVTQSAKSLASGKRINSASDDAAGLGIASHTHAAVKGLKQSARNAHDAISMAQIMNGAIEEIGTELIRLRELAIASSNGTYSNSERQMLNQQAQGLLEEIDRIAKSTTHLDEDLFIGKERKLDIQIDIGSGAQNRITLDLNDLAQTTYALGISDLDLSTEHRSKLSLAKIDYAGEQVSESRSKIGAFSSALAVNLSKLQTMIQGGQEVYAQITNTDYASETANYLKNKIQSKAQVALSSQASKNLKNTLYQIIKKS